MKVCDSLTLVELAVILGKKGRDINRNQANDFIGGYGSFAI